MKTIRIKILFFILLVPFYAFSQDTISTYITSGCLPELRFAGPPEFHFSRTADSITIYGKIGANCGSSHIAIIRKTEDSIIVTTLDTGSLTTCSCDFNFKIQIKASSTDTLVVFNDLLFNLNTLSNGLVELKDRNELIDVTYDPAVENLRISLKAGVQIRMFNIFDGSGHQRLSLSNDRSLIDFSGFESGLYLLDFTLNDNSHIIKKVLKE